MNDDNGNFINQQKRLIKSLTDKFEKELIELGDDIKKLEFLSRKPVQIECTKDDPFDGYGGMFYVHPDVNLVHDDKDLCLYKCKHCGTLIEYKKQISTNGE